MTTFGQLRESSERVSRFHGEQSSDSGLPGPDSLHEEFNWRPVTPISQRRFREASFAACGLRIAPSLCALA